MGRPYSLDPVIEFHLDPRSGVATYLQIVQQVKEALRLGLLDVGDQLPTVREMREINDPADGAEDLAHAP